MSRCYTQITLADRRRLYQLKERKLPIGEIARQLGCSPRTVANYWTFGKRWLQKELAVSPTDDSPMV